MTEATAMVHLKVSKLEEIAPLRIYLLVLLIA
jgi:hypothetical protein